MRFHLIFLTIFFISEFLSSIIEVGWKFSFLESSRTALSEQPNRQIVFWKWKVCGSKEKVLIESIFVQLFDKPKRNKKQKQNGLRKWILYNPSPILIVIVAPNHLVLLSHGRTFLFNKFKCVKIERFFFIFMKFIGAEWKFLMKNLLNKKKLNLVIFVKIFQSFLEKVKIYYLNWVKKLENCQKNH